MVILYDVLGKKMGSSLCINYVADVVILVVGANKYENSELIIAKYSEQSNVCLLNNYI